MTLNIKKINANINSNVKYANHDDNDDTMDNYNNINYSMATDNVTYNDDVNYYTSDTVDVTWTMKSMYI